MRPARVGARLCCQGGARAADDLDVDRTAYGGQAIARRLCGWEHPGQVPSEATFSRAFAEFARSELPGRLHEALIKRSHKERLVGHISRDATAIEAREKPVKTAAPGASTNAEPLSKRQPPKRKRGRPRKGEVVEKKGPRRLERQAAMSLDEMLSDPALKHVYIDLSWGQSLCLTSWILPSTCG